MSACRCAGHSSADDDQIAGITHSRSLPRQPDMIPVARPDAGRESRGLRIDGRLQLFDGRRAGRTVLSTPAEN